MTHRKLHLHGSLKKLAPDGLEVDAVNVIAAINAMCKLLGLKPSINGRQLVKVVGFDTVKSLQDPSDQVDLHIVPVFMGGKNVLGGVVRIVVGAILIAASFYLGPEIGAYGASLLFSAGASLVVGGLINLLFPVKQADGAFSKYLGAPQNTTKIGTRIPLILGRAVKHYGQILSYQIDAVAS